MADIREGIRGSLRFAMKTRDATAVSALRSLLAAIDDAKAVAAEQAPVSGISDQHLASSVPGLAAAEVPRRELSPADLRAVVRTAIIERQDAAAEYDRVGRADAADRLRREVGVLSPFIDGETDSEA